MDLRTIQEQLNLIATNVGQLEGRLRKLESNQQSIVNQINEWAKSIDSIDQVAFIAIYLQIVGSLDNHKITKGGVKETHEFIGQAFKKLEAYSKEVVAEVEKEKKRGSKKS